MDIHTFIANYQEAFGQHAELPIAFWYSDRMEASTEKVTGCLFKCMKQVRRRQNRQSQQRNNHLRRRQVLYRITEMPERVPGFCLLEREIQENSRKWW